MTTLSQPFFPQRHSFFSVFSAPRCLALLLIGFGLIHPADLLLAQTPSIQWQKTIGGTLGDEVRSVQKTSDGGYIIGGSSYSNSSGDKTENSKGGWDYWVIRLDASGNILWQKTIGGNSTDKLQSVQQTTDLGFILGGYSLSGVSGDKSENNLGGNDYWVVKLDASGGIVWENTIGGSGHDELYSVKQTPDGGYVLGGSSASGISGDKTENSLGIFDYWVVKLDETGTIVWQKTIGGNDFDELWSVSVTTDGYFLAGSSFSSISGNKTENSLSWDYWLVLINSAGTVVAQNTIGGSGSDFIRAAVPTSGGGYFIGGYSNSGISGDKTESTKGDNDYWVLKLDASLAIEWQKDLGGTNGDILYSVLQTSDGGYLAGGYSVSGISGDKTENNKGFNDFWVLKLDNSGAISWQKTIGGSSADELYAMAQNTAGDYFLAGTSGSNISGDKTADSKGDIDIWAMKLTTGTAPSFSACPAGPLTANAAANECTAPVSYTVAASGSPAPVLTYAFSGATTGSGNETGSGELFHMGDTEVTVSATNDLGTTTCVFTVSVSGSMPIQNATQSENYCNLSDALTNAADSDHIMLQAGNYTGCVTVDRNLYLEATGGAVVLDCLVLDGTGKMLTLDSDLTINQLTLSNGLINTNGKNLRVGSVTGGNMANYIITQ